MPVEASTTVEPPATGEAPVDPKVFDRLVLPDLAERIRTSLIFLAAAQTIYAVTILFSQGLAYETRAAINLLRTVVLWWCVWALRKERSRRDALIIQGIGL